MWANESLLDYHPVILEPIKDVESMEEVGWGQGRQGEHTS